MSSSDEAAFLAAILATPDDDTPRLVFADWLDERGQNDDPARAALIRAQCRLEHLGPGPERRAAERETKALLKAHAKYWTAPLRAAGLGDGWAFRRGFIDAVSISPTLFVRHGELIFAHAPLLRTVRFPHAQSEVTQLAGCPYLARLASVDLAQMCTCGRCPIDVELRDLFQSKHAAGLTRLNLSRDRIDADMTRALGTSPHLTRLSELDLTGNPLGVAGAIALLAAPGFARLRRLSLRDTDLDNTAAEVLAVAPHLAAAHLPELVELDLADNLIRATGTRALAGSALVARLVALDLSDNPIGEGGAAALAKLPAETRLERLDVSRCRLSPKALQALKKRFGKGLKA